MEYEDEKLLDEDLDEDDNIIWKALYFLADLVDGLPRFLWVVIKILFVIVCVLFVCVALPLIAVFGLVGLCCGGATNSGNQPNIRRQLIKDQRRPPDSGPYFGPNY